MSAQHSPRRRARSTALVATALAALLCLSTTAAHAQNPAPAPTPTPAYRVLVDSVAVGSASAVANLPVEHATQPLHPDSALPGRQTAAARQASVVLTTTDPALLAVLRAWMGANNSGSKDTVQPKVVEIDQIGGTGGPFRYVLHDAWPSRIDPGAPSVVTIVYQRAEVLR